MSHLPASCNERVILSIFSESIFVLHTCHSGLAFPRSLTLNSSLLCFPLPPHVSLIHSLFNFMYRLHLLQKVLSHRVQSSSLVFGALPSLHFPPRRQPQFRSTEGFLSTCLYLLWIQSTITYTLPHSCVAAAVT